MLKASQKWGRKTIIDFHDFHKGRALENLNKAKLYSPLVVIDPILPERNAAAALSKEKLLDFIESARKFFETPSEKYFKRDIVTLSKLKKR